MRFEYRLVLRTPAGEFYSEPKTAKHYSEVQQAIKTVDDLGGLGTYLHRAEAKKNGRDWETL